MFMCAFVYMWQRLYFFFKVYSTLVHCYRFVLCVIYTIEQYARLFNIVSYFQPSLMLETKLGAYHKEFHYCLQLLYYGVNIDKHSSLSVQVRK